MKLAVLVAFSPDRRSARLLSGAMPADEAIKEIKAMITAGVAPDASKPLVAACALGDMLRKHTFKVSGDPDAEVLVAEVDEVSALMALNARLTDELAVASAALANAKAKAAKAAEAEAARAAEAEAAKAAEAEAARVAAEAESARLRWEAEDQAAKAEAVKAAELASKGDAKKGGKPAKAE